MGQVPNRHSFKENIQMVNKHMEYQMQIEIRLGHLYRFSRMATIQTWTTSNTV